MEQNLNESFDSELIYFHLEYKGQDIKNNIPFQEWYKKTDNYVKEVNSKHEKLSKSSIFRPGMKFYTISFCNNCRSYVICSISSYSYSSITCLKCRQLFCPGCYKSNKNGENNCLKGYLKLLYLRTINGRCILEKSNIIINIIFIIFFLFFTPFYINFILSNFGFYYLNKSSNDKNKEDNKCLAPYIIIVIYSLLIGILMSHYLIFFFPILFTTLLPGIFSKKYFYTLMVLYLSIGFPGTTFLKNLE